VNDLAMILDLLLRNHLIAMGLCGSPELILEF